MDKPNINVKNKCKKPIKSNRSIKINTEIELNGRIYFVPDKIIGTAIVYLSTEHRNLYKIIFAMYLDSLITNYKIQNISRINKNHINDANICSEKLISYILTGTLVFANLSLSIIETEILEKIPEYLLQNLNPNIIEKIE